jgi:hypothetical protein
MSACVLWGTLFRSAHPKGKHITAQISGSQQQYVGPQVISTCMTSRCAHPSRL